MFMKFHEHVNNNNNNNYNCHNIIIHVFVSNPVSSKNKKIKPQIVIYKFFNSLQRIDYVLLKLDLLEFNKL